jgi:hypothetical protein
MSAELDAYHALCAYTLTRGDAAFIHQHVVDAFAAQQATEQDKPIKITFALAGLYLLIERRFSGRQVQRAHMQLARRKQQWPRFALPTNRGAITAVDVLNTSASLERDAAIHAWCASVWASYAESRETVAALLRQHAII